MSIGEAFVSVSIGAFSCVLAVFQLVGFINFSLCLHRTSGVTIGAHTWSSSIWWLFQLTLTLVNGVLAKRNYDCLFRGMLLTDAMNNYFKFGIGLLTVFVTLADSWFGAETHRSIWMHYRDLATRHRVYGIGLLDRRQTARLLGRYVAIFLLVVAVCGMVEYQVYRTLAVGTQWHCFWTHNAYPYTVSHLRHMFHLLHIMLMTANLTQLRIRLDRLRPSGDADGAVPVDVALVRVEECRTVYTELWLVNEAINELFGFSQALNIACSFAQIAFDLYWVYAIWVTYMENVELQMLCFVPTPIIVGILMHAAKQHQLAVVALEGTLLDLDCRLDGGMIALRCYFLSQMRRNRLRLTARDIFDFDYTLIRKLAIVTITYIIIFVELAH